MKTISLIALSLALGSALVFEGSFGHRLVLLTAFMVLAVPVLLIGVWTALAARRGVWKPWHARFWHATGLSACGLLVSWSAGAALHTWRAHQTREFVERAVAVLDAEHAQSGEYPQSLPLEKLGPTPKWLHSPQSCTLSAQNFRFAYWDPADLMSGYEFTSETRTWTAFD